MLICKGYIASLAGALFAVSTFSYAQTNGYAGIAGGQSTVDVSGYDTASSYKVFVGRSFSDNLALEAAYTSLGKFNVSGASDTYLEVNGFEVTVVGNYPVSSSVSLFAKAGLYSWNLDAVLFGTNIGSDNGSDFTYGVGANVEVGNNLGIQIEYQKYDDISGGNMGTVYAGVNFGF